MADSGHVFVVRARIENPDHDATILPTDDDFSVTEKAARQGAGGRSIAPPNDQHRGDVQGLSRQP